jgi:hypothetical protein
MKPGIVAALACVVLATGCVTPEVFHLPRAESPTATLSCTVPVPEREVLVGVAMSGGGSRAALFGAAGLEALGRLQTRDGGSVLEQVAYLSSVSGGSLAASYYALNKPPRNVKVLTPEGEFSNAYRTFFEQYRKVLSQNFGSELFWRQIGSFRWFNPSLVALSLAEILRQKLLGPVTWEDIHRREANGDSPGLIINATLYNNGRRFAITTLPSQAFQYDFIQSLQQSLASQGKAAEIAPILKLRWEHLVPMTPLDLHFDICKFGLPGAVAGSASFPPTIGPTTFQVEGDDTYWHLGDGGLYENQGAESLLFLLLKQLQLRKTRRVLILALDSSFPFSVGERHLGRRSEPFSLFTFDFNRIPGIMEERASTYQALFFRSLQIEGAFPDDRSLRVLPLRHIDARWRDDMSDLPPVCRNEPNPPQTPTAVVERLAEIPTRFRVRSECDRQLLAAAAYKLVEQHRQEILEFLDEAPAPGAVVVPKH